MKLFLSVFFSLVVLYSLFANGMFLDTAHVARAELNIEGILVEVAQAETVAINKATKYEQIKITSVADGFYEVHEYVMPDKRVGYQVLFYDKNGRILSSEGVGPEAAARTFSVPLNKSATST